MTHQVGRTFRFAICDQAPRRARRAVRHAVLAWEYGEELADVAELLTSEVVSNAVRHAVCTEECVVRIGVGGRLLTVSVYDDGDGSPRVKNRRTTPNAAGGWASWQRWPPIGAFGRTPAARRCSSPCGSRRFRCTCTRRSSPGQLVSAE